ncbi:hypothetical protein FHX41_5387 [Actinomadura hallensis]|uniref:Uncharacterized protein n=1 Tax=Actinomadura hallensis TaxID=337895 RepID=A0A543IM57_9ACTN|nr:hypothetical protein [Actinomadura hallensis]TQM71618.1 hypothetical protein FHX41_5387 [Actinomadura hallensis]
MSASEDTRESGEEAATPAVPGDSAPPSFGASTPPADPPPADGDPAEPAEAKEPAASPGALKLPTFGLQAPWWAAESTETGPPPDEKTAPAEPADVIPADVKPSMDTAADDTATEDTAGDDPGEEESSAASRTATLPLGTLVAGIGVPKVDSRGAVPATPIVKRSPMSGDTDPDGIPAVRPDAEQPTGTAEPAATDTGTTATDTAEKAGGAADDTAEADTVTDIPAVTVSKDTGTPDTGASTAATPTTGAAESDTAVDIPAVKGEAKEGPGETPQDGQATAFEQARAAEDAPGDSGPVLVPDAILPAGVTPPTGSGPFPHTAPDAAGSENAQQTTVITPVYHAEGGVPLDVPAQRPGQADQGASKSSGRTKRRLALVGGGAAAIIAAGVALFAIGGTGGSGSDAGRTGDAKAAESPAAAQSTPPPSPAASPSAAPTASAAPPSRIDHERTDREPLAFQDVFPTKTIRLGGRTYTRDRWSLNRDASYAARGSMLRALERERCRKIIRATFIDRSSSLAVTSGIAVMPTKEAALRVSRAGDPSRYEWFRGMGGKRAPDLDRAGGYAAATVRGRYVAYAYVQWADGRPARPGDPVIKQAAKRFLDYDLRPIVDRARR